MARHQKSWGKLNQEWVVQAHGPLEPLANNLWRVWGDLPEMSGMRRHMLIIKLEDERLLIHNAICVDDERLAEIEALGAPAVLIVPSAIHRMDAAAWKKRFPDLLVYAPAGAHAAVSEIVEVNGDYDAIDAPPVRARHVAGIEEKEGVVEVPSDDGVTLIFNDLIFNMPHLHGTFGFFYKVLGSSGGPRVTRIARFTLVRDRAAVRADLEQLADTPDLKRVVPAHIDVIDENAPAVLRRIAAALG